MASYLAAFVTSFLIAFTLLPIVIKFFKRRNWTDTPGGRKIHKKVTPSLGGTAIFIGFSLSLLVWTNISDWQILKFIFSGLFIVFLLGIRDDLVSIRAIMKLAGQIFAVGILITAGVSINSFHGLFGIYELPNWLGYFITIGTCVILMNAFNLIDGLDGLAGSIGVIGLLFFGVWFAAVEDTLFALLCFAMVGGIVAFLVFNWEPSEIFMGDTGSMVIGLLLSLVTIRFMDINGSLEVTHAWKYTSTVGTAIGIVIIPIWDTLRIIMLRLYKGQSPFKPDKSHIHHSIMRLGLTHAKTSLLLAAINLFFIVFILLLKPYPDVVVIPVIVAGVILISVVLDRMMARKLKRK